MIDKQLRRAFQLVLANGSTVREQIEPTFPYANQFDRR